MKPRRTLFAVGLLAMLVTAALPASASVRREGAGDALPFYARILLLDKLEWSAVIFYRPPECVPDTFNLDDFFDIPGAFECGPATTDGFDIRKSEDDPVPYQVHLDGLGAVPIYFVKTAELEGALADTMLTIGDLEALPSLLIGSATDYHEVLHPSEVTKGHLTVVASGTLSDGRTFRLKIPGDRIVFR
jgi:hypothetical protein